MHIINFIHSADASNKQYPSSDGKYTPYIGHFPDGDWGTGTDPPLVFTKKKKKKIKHVPLSYPITRKSKKIKGCLYAFKNFIHAD